MKPTRLKILVLLAAFNGSKWILEQVDSILRQVDVDVDLVISDDGSTDGTRTMIERLTADSRVHAICPKAPTRSAAQNFLWLIRSTPADEYDFIAFSDQDDVWDEAKLYRGCKALIEAGAQGYSSAVVAFWSDDRKKTLVPMQKPTTSDFLFESAGQGCTYILDPTFYRSLRTFFVQHETATKRLHYHDWAIYAVARSWNLKWVFDQKPGMRYRQHENNDTGARASMSGIIIRLGRIKHGWYTEQLRTIASICLEASPEDPLISTWNRLLGQPSGILRRWHIAGFCFRGGRRRWYDQAILLGAVVAGWI
jgi:rhamnosyltransferase